MSRKDKYWCQSSISMCLSNYLSTFKEIKEDNRIFSEHFKKIRGNRNYRWYLKVLNNK